MIDRFDGKACLIVLNYIKNVKLNDERTPAIYISWKSKSLQNYKYLLSTDYQGLYFELTYNRCTNEWYLDVYEKKENVVIDNFEL